MPAGLGRAIVALVLVPWLVFASALPQEHLHEADADHPLSITHRHTALHSGESHGHDGLEFDHREDHVLWLSNAGLVQNTYHLEPSAALIERAFKTLPDVAPWVVTAVYDASLPHGPPRPSKSPRAPPLASRLV